MTERLTIARVGHRGDGVADTADGPVFVPCALPGEVVEVEPLPGHPDRRHLLCVVTESAERIAPFCPHFGVCGGCQTQHWDFERYREWKHALVGAALRQADVDAPVGALIDAHGRVVGMLVLGPRRRVLAIPASTISRTEAVTRAAQLYSFGEGSLVTILGA